VSIEVNFWSGTFSVAGLILEAKERGGRGKRRRKIFPLEKHLWWFDVEQH